MSNNKITPRKEVGLSLTDIDNLEGFEKNGSEDVVFGLTLNKHGYYTRKEINIPKKIKWIMDLSIDIFSLELTKARGLKIIPIKSVKNKGTSLGVFYPDVDDSIGLSRYKDEYCLSFPKRTFPIVRNNKIVTSIKLVFLPLLFSYEETVEKEKKNWNKLCFGIKVYLGDVDNVFHTLIPGLQIKWFEPDKICYIYKIWGDDMLIYFDGENGEKQPTNQVGFIQNYEPSNTEISVYHNLSLCALKITSQNIDMETLISACDF